MRHLSASLGLTILCGLTADAIQAQTQVESATRAFPLQAEEVHEGSALRLSTVPALLAEVHDLANVTLQGVPYPTGSGFDDVDVVLKRLPVVTPDAQLFLDGKLAGGHAELTAGFSAWVGQVAGEADSDVYLAFSSTGSRGWIRRGQDKVSFIAQRNDDGGWDFPDSIVVNTSDPLYIAAQDGLEFDCQTQTVPVDARPLRAPGGQQGNRHAGGVLPPTQASTLAIECKMAVESDVGYFNLFGNMTAAQNYMLSLWGAVSSRYLAQVNTVITIPYLQLYSGSDPWTTNNSLDRLFEFDDYWTTSGFPNGAHLGHLVSGDSLGGGVAYYAGYQGVGLFCDAGFGVGVSGNLAGLTPFPVPLQDGLNWDFIVVAHETGHNWGTTHTHEICPTPVDQCSPSFGACQVTQSCQTGTIMSYCHLCPGGIFNSQTSFDPSIAADLTLAAQAAVGSCLLDYHLASSTVRNGTGVNPLGFTELTPSVLGGSWTTSVDIGSTGHVASLVSLSTAGPASLFLGAFTGEVLVLPPTIKPVSVAAGLHVIGIPSDPVLAGVTIYTQGAGVLPGVFLFNAIDICLGN